MKGRRRAVTSGNEKPPPFHLGAGLALGALGVLAAGGIGIAQWRQAKRTKRLIHADESVLETMDALIGVAGKYNVTALDLSQGDGRGDTVYLLNANERD